MKRNIVITIERLYGSGGRTVGEMLAEDLGIHYYDQELVKLCSEESGIAEELFVNADESLQKSRIFRFGKGKYKGEVLGPGSSGFVSPENLFNYQAKVLKKLAESMSCVIVGRCGNFVLREYENVASVFVHAPMPYLLEQAALKQSRRGMELRSYVEKTNENRAEYYEYYTGNKWERAQDYDLCLDSSRLGFDKCVEQIKAYLKIRFGEDILG